MLKIQNLTYFYPETVSPAIENINFEVKKGQIFGFLGPSGAGKSTTQKVLIGLLKDYQGHVTVDGQEVNTVSKDYYEHIGISFEIANHYSKLTAVENLAYFASFYKNPTTDLMGLLERVGLEDHADVQVSQFSKGMKNRLCFIRALIHDPEILFLDEPTAGLDPMNANRIITIIKQEKAQGKTIFLTTHNMYVAEQLCDQVAFIVDGQIKVINSPKNLKLEHGERSVKVEYGNGKLETKEFALKGLGTNTAFIELINQPDIQTIHTQEATLDRVFIEVTGRKLD